MTLLLQGAGLQATTSISGDDYMQVVVTITNDQIKALPTTPVEIIAAPGANKLIVPFTILLHMKWVTDGDYTNIDAGSSLAVDIAGSFMAHLRQSTLSGMSALLVGGGPDGTWVTMTLNQLAAATTTTATPSVNAHHHQGVADSGWYDADIVNKPLKIYIENGSAGDLTGGAAGNTMDVIVFYQIVDA